MNRHSAFWIRNGLLTTLLCANLLVDGLSVRSLLQSRLQFELRATTSADNVARALDESISTMLEKLDISLMASVDEVERRMQGGTLDTVGLEAFLERRRQMLPDVQSIRILNADGIAVLGNGVDKAASVNLSDRDYFIHARDEGKGRLHVSKPLLSRISGKYVVVLARRIEKPDGSFAGIAYATVTLAQFERLMASYQLGPSATITLRELDTSLVTRYPPIPDLPAGRIGNRVVSDEYRRVIDSGLRSVNFSTASGSDGTPRAQSFRRMARAPYLLIVGVARKDYLTGWVHEAYASAAMMGGFLVLSLLSGVFLYRAFKGTSREAARNRLILDRASDGIQILDARGRIIEANQRLCTMLGYEPAELLALSPEAWARHWVDPARPDEPFSLLGGCGKRELQLRRKNGPAIEAEIELSPFLLDGEACLYVSIRDIGERKLAEDKIRQLAYFDPLTQLPNRRLMLDRLEHALAASSRSHQFGALVMLDLDNFKVLNDTRGHDVGDQLLVEVARRITAEVRQEDTVCRLGGDEYVLVLDALDADEAASALLAELVAEKVRSVLDQPYVLPPFGAPHHGSCSVGVTLFRGTEVSVDTLLKQADLALYQAKGEGRNAVRFFNPEVQAVINASAELETRLRRGLAQGEFQLHYQPQVDRQGRTFGAEALLRWTQADGTQVSPADFIPLAEASGLIVPLGLWVLDTACAQLRRWARMPECAELQLSINVSARQFHEPDFVDQVRERVIGSGIRPELLKLELTEGVVLNDVNEVISRIQRIRELGVKFSLDDFGTGFSSLSYLKRLPLDEVKIDRSFVRDIIQDANDAAIVNAIIMMGRSLELNVCAEGVETQEQADFLDARGCNSFQGYLFGRPQPGPDFERRLARAKQVAPVPG